MIDAGKKRETELAAAEGAPGRGSTIRKFVILTKNLANWKMLPTGHFSERFSFAPQETFQTYPEKGRGIRTRIGLKPDGDNVLLGLYKSAGKGVAGFKKATVSGHVQKHAHLAVADFDRCALIGGIAFFVLAYGRKSNSNPLQLAYDYWWAFSPGSFLITATVSGWATASSFAKRMSRPIG